MHSKIIVGMSGGVDSSLAALLLQQAGHNVEGLFMKNWEGEDSESHCNAAADLKDAEAVCDRLNIPLHTVNFSQEYWNNVFENFLSEHRLGRTPNPDVICNREIKFKVFLKHALSLGATQVATGHYSKTIFDAENKQYQLHKGEDPNKDQSYFLYTVSHKILEKVQFPIGHLQKSMVRQLAAEANFDNHRKKDSTGICFIGERKFNNFLSTYFKKNPGTIETDQGKKIGEHDGLMFYTIGQRQGLKIGGLKNSLPAPWYVLKKDLARNTLIVGQGENHPWLFQTSLEADTVEWVQGLPPASEFECYAKIRYRQTDQNCRVQVQAGSDTDKKTRVKVEFKEGQRAVTPGQSIVFYQGTRCLGGGIIL